MTETNSEYDVIVIGAGPNGLTCGSYLAKAGAKVLLLEKKWETGGGLATDDFQSPFRFNLHAVYMMMAELMPPWKDFNLANNNVEFIRPETQMAFHYTDETALVFYTNPKKTADSIARFSTDDAATFEKMYVEFKKISDEILIPATYVPPIPGLENLALLQQSELGRLCVEISEQTPESSLDYYGFKDPRVRGALLYIMTMWGLDPDSTSVGYLIPLYVYRMMNTAIVAGGSHTLSSALNAPFKANRGHVIESAEVTKILMKEGRAVGARLADGREFFARAVVSTLNPEQTFIKCIDAKEMPNEDVVDSAKLWRWEERSFFTAHFGIKGEVPEFKAAAYNPDVNRALIHVFGYETEADVKRHIAEVGERKLGKPCGHFTCTTQFDAHQASEGPCGPLNTLRYETWASYAVDSGSWDEIKHDYRQQCFELIKQYSTNLGDAKVLYKFSYSPVDIERRLDTMKMGSFKHGEYNALQMGYLRPNEDCSRHRTPVEGLYLAGASSYPGGMILLGSGYLASNVVAEDLGLNKWWTPPDYVVAAQEKGYLPS